MTPIYRRNVAFRAVVLHLMRISMVTYYNSIGDFLLIDFRIISNTKTRLSIHWLSIGKTCLSLFNKARVFTRATVFLNDAITKVTKLFERWRKFCLKNILFQKFDQSQRKKEKSFVQRKIIEHCFVKYMAYRQVFFC